MDINVQDTHAIHLAMAGAEYEYCPFMFWYPPAVCYYKRFGSASEKDDTNEAVATDGLDISPETSSSGDVVKDGVAATSRLLALPVEVRLRIYYWAYRMSPIQPKELAAGYPIPMLCRYVLHPLDLELEQRIEQEIENEMTLKELTGDQCDDDDDAAAPGDKKWDHTKGELEKAKLVKERTKEKMRELNKSVTGLLGSDRPLAGMPSDLLATCRQIYFEARGLPFEHNEFVFLNWFSSGLNAAAAVTKAQRPWQRTAMRFVRLEIMAEDLARSAALKKWAELCGRGRTESWIRGLRGLRLKIVGQVGRRSGDDEDLDEFVDGLEEAGGAARWVEGGRLAELEHLERLEIEIIKNAWGSKEKMDWCAAVQAALRARGSQAEVVSMARIL